LVTIPVGKVDNNQFNYLINLIMENIKIKSTVYPKQRLTEDQWKAELRVGIRWNASKFTDRSQQMMNLWDEERRVKYLKQLTLA
jgi:hypothetical protein